jgi:hypothetical protein
MLEIWGSWEVDPRIFEERLQRAWSAMQEINRILNESHAQSQQSSANAMYDWNEVFRGDAIFGDLRTGEEGTTATGWVNETIDALNQAAGYERLEYVPLRDWWQGR